jgi:hypothetical protein
LWRGGDENRKRIQNSAPQRWKKYEGEKGIRVRENLDYERHVGL